MYLGLGIVSCSSTPSDSRCAGQRVVQQILPVGGYRIDLI